MDNKVKELRKHLVIGFHSMIIYCFLIQVIYYIVNLSVGNERNIIPTEIAIGMTQGILTIIASAILIYFINKDKLDVKIGQLFEVLSVTNILFYIVLVSTVEYSYLAAHNMPISVSCQFTMGFSIAALLVVLVSLLFLRVKNNAVRIGYFSASAFVAVFALVTATVHFSSLTSIPFLLVLGMGFKIVPVVFASILFILSIFEEKESVQK